MKVRRIIGLALIGALVLILIPAGLYLATPQLLSWQAGNVLRQLGCREVSAHFERPQWNQISAAEISLRDCPELKISLLQADSLTLSYDPRQLLLEQRLQELRISGLTLSLDPGEPADTQSPASPPLLLPGYLLRQLPFERGEVDLKLLQLSLPQQTVQLSGRLQLSPAKLETHLSGELAGFETLNAHLEWSADNRLALQISQRQQPLYELDGQLKLSDDNQLRLQATDKVAAGRLLPVLQSAGYLAQLPLDWQLDGHSRSRWSLQISRQALTDGNWRAASISQQLQLKLQLETGQGVQQRALLDSDADISARLDWKATGLQWQLDPDSSLSLGLRPGTLPHAALANRWQLSAGDNLSGTARWDDGFSLSSTDGQLTIRPQGQSELHSVTRIDGFHWQPQRAWARFDIDLQRQDAVVETLRLRQLRAHSRGAVAIAGNFISLNLDSGSYLTSESLDNNDTRIEQLNLVTSVPLQLQTAFSSQHWSLSPISINLASGRISNGDLYAAGLSGQLRMRLPERKAASLDGEVEVTLHRPGRRQWSLPDLQLALPWQLKFPRLDFQASVSIPEKQLTLSGKGRMQLQSRRLQSDWKLSPAPIASLMTLRPAELLRAEQMPVVSAGKLSAALIFNSRTVAGKQQWQAEADLGVTGLEAGLDDWRAGSSRAALQFSAASGDAASGHGIVRIDRLSGPLQASDIGATFSLTTDTTGVPSLLNVHNASLNIFGGQLRSAPFRLQLPELLGELRVGIQSLGLQQILALQPKTEIIGEGRLSGYLPVQLKSDGVYVSGGKVAALSPGGMLAYRPSAAGSAAASSNYGLGIALQALSDFRYHSLNIGIDYQPDGTLLLDTALKGRNPGWQNGQPIDFNIRIEQNLLRLLQALQFSDKLNEGLDQKLRQR